MIGTSLRDDVARIIANLDELDRTERRGVLLATGMLWFSRGMLVLIVLNVVADVVTGVIGSVWPLAILQCALGVYFAWSLGYWKRSRAEWREKQRETAAARATFDRTLDMIVRTPRSVS